jgi:hypothetical protein
VACQRAPLFRQPATAVGVGIAREMGATHSDNTLATASGAPRSATFYKDLLTSLVYTCTLTLIMRGLWQSSHQRFVALFASQAGPTRWSYDVRRFNAWLDSGRRSSHHHLSPCKSYYIWQQAVRYSSATGSHGGALGSATSGDQSPHKSYYISERRTKFHALYSARKGIAASLL